MLSNKNKSMNLCFKVSQVTYKFLYLPEIDRILASFTEKETEKETDV